MVRLDFPRTRWISRIVATVLVLGLAGNFIWFSPWVQKLLYPVPHKQLIFKYSSEYRIDPYLVTAIIRRESKFFYWAESAKGAKGLMQIMPQTAQWVSKQIPLAGYSDEQLYEPETNIRIGCWYLASLKEEFNGNIPIMIAAYNGGRGNVQQWIKEQRWSGKEHTLEDIPFPETREYVKAVLHDYYMYHELYD
ncbi:transglycosylase SLT domain-containing protein [Heliobacillus mobilis]|uniref:Transglycosylase SLT domain-containing protein n=1 Tax=Heliobacterium mobile TaxID=28064 RepID=A0A6I3SJD7_HELMO|nr:transglycosylase SLT domain-containing protein [Heliobacterium mobile]